jgi:type I restriction enzyme R subunit
MGELLAETLLLLLISDRCQGFLSQKAEFLLTSGLHAVSGRSRAREDRRVARAMRLDHTEPQHNQSIGRRGIAIREGLLKGGEADYLLFGDSKALGTVEAKPEGHTLVGVEEQSEKYGKGLLDIYPKWREPLPFAYESTGTETRFTSRVDPSPTSRNVFAFHTPETLLEWIEQPAQLSARLADLPARDQMPKSNLWSAQIEAIQNLEKSLAVNKRRALIPMATGSAKTYTAVYFVYRLIKLAGARRVLFLVDRGNLGDQTLKEFQQFVTPDDGRKFTELYNRASGSGARWTLGPQGSRAGRRVINVQHLQSAQLDRVSRVCISTIQRLYSMLCSLVFWIEIPLPHGQFTRGDKQMRWAAFTQACGMP